jgi:phosphopantetheinyl transferase (holo-ACP synthase)
LSKPIFVGNDVVDLEQPRSRGKARHERFVARVFADDEQRAIRTSEDPDVELWSRWTAKEAAYKVISKLLPRPPVFAHRAFRTSWHRHDEPPNDVARTGDGTRRTIRRGVVRYESLEVEVSVTRSAGTLHALAASDPRGLREGPAAARSEVEALGLEGAPWSMSLADLRAGLSELELEAVHSRQSAAVRLGARAALADHLSLPEARIQIVCDPGQLGLRPPRVLIDGQRSAADVSLSHDGDWIAWATWVPSDGDIR